MAVLLIYEWLRMYLRLSISLALLPFAFFWTLLSDSLNRLLCPFHEDLHHLHEDAVVLITGGSSGIGKAAAVFLAQTHGCSVFVGVRTPKYIDELRARHPSIYPIMLEVTDHQDIHVALETVREFIGRKKGRRLVGVINNAGLSISGAFETISMEQWQHVIDVNTFAAMDIAHIFLPMLRQHKGRLVNIGSTSGRESSMSFATYSASKFALRAWSLALREELAPFEVPVSLIEPALTRTRLVHQVISNLSPGQTDYAALNSFCHKVASYLVKTSVSTDTTSKAISHALLSTRPRASYLPACNAFVVAAASTLPEELSITATFANFYRLLYSTGQGWNMPKPTD